MATRQVLVELDDKVVHALEAEAAAAGVSAAALIGRLAEEHLATPEGARWIDRYQGASDSTGDEWGDLDAQLAGAAAEAFRRLDEDETDDLN